MRSILMLAPVLFLAAACSDRAPPAPAPEVVAQPPSVVPDLDLASSPKPGDVAALIANVPHVRQKPDFCGEACAEMVLGWVGTPTTQDQFFDLAGVDPSLGRGAITGDLKRGLERVGFDVGAVWYQVDPSRAGPELEGHFKVIYDDLRRGIPSIVCMHYGDGPRTTEHFRLIVGYDPATDEVVYHEPAEDHGGYRRMKRARMLRLWPLTYDKALWTVIRFRLERLSPGEAGTRSPSAAPVAAPAKRGGHAPSEYAQHILALKEKLGRDFTFVIEPPFVVAGDEAEAMVRERAAETVRWAKDKLAQDFFTEEPKRILDVLLFKNAQSYRKRAIDLFHEAPTTPYGYYSSEHGALVMNIATGGGTLVHEMVHPFVEADFPAAPPWLNEGLGSLFEQSADRGGHIVGLTNWRLAGLQRAIASHHMGALTDLFKADARAFYGEDPGTNYAASRYLCHYLQERGLLTRFYKEFRGHQADDPTGVATLKSVLGEQDLTAFQRRWETYVSGLRFPG